MKTKTSYLTRLALLSAILLIMSYTPLGYLYIGPIAITFLTIPVIIGSVTMGPGAGAILGLIFGLTSFAKSFSNPMGMAFISINVVYMFILCVVPRVLEGYLCALAYKFLNRNKKNSLWKVTTASFTCPALNTILYMGTLVLLFGNSEYIMNRRGGQSVLAFVVGFVGVQALVEAAVCTFFGTAISMALFKYMKSEK